MDFKQHLAGCLFVMRSERVRRYMMMMMIAAPAQRATLRQPFDNCKHFI